MGIHIQPPALEIHKPSSRVSCDDGNTLYLYCLLWKPRAPCDYQNVAGEILFKFQYLYIARWQPFWTAQFYIVRLSLQPWLSPKLYLSD